MLLQHIHVPVDNGYRSLLKLLISDLVVFNQINLDGMILQNFRSA